MIETPIQMRNRLLPYLQDMISCRIVDFEEIYYGRPKWRSRWLARLYNETQVLTVLLRKLEEGFDPHQVALQMNTISNRRWPDKEDRMEKFITYVLRQVRVAQ